MKGLLNTFMIVLGAFSLGSIAGASTVLCIPVLRKLLFDILEIRLLAPMEAVSEYGKTAMTLLIFLNNSIPAVLSYVFPFLIAEINWTPPLNKSRRNLLLTSFSLIASFLIGFFGLGAGLALELYVAGAKGMFFLLASAWLHGPIEFASILLCVGEPLRLTEEEDANKMITRLERDLRILLTVLLGLFIAALIEVFAMI
jgi:hypothetical protein